MEKEIKIIPGGIAVDDRGALRFCNDFNFRNVKRFYEVENHRRGFIRAWHGHRNEGKYVWASGGSFLIGLVPLDATHGDLSAVTKIVLSDSKPNIVWIPPGYYNGFKNLTEGGRLMYFSTSSIDDHHGDDIRLPYDAWNIWEDDYR